MSIHPHLPPDPQPGPARLDPRQAARRQVAAFPDVVLETVLTTLESSLEEQGWDAPWRLWSLHAMDALGDALDDRDGDLLMCAPVEVDTQVPPAQGIAGISLDPTAMAAVLAFEAWSAPSRGGPADRLVDPAAHPSRIEIRSVLAVCADGRVLAVSRRRGADGPEPSDGPAPSGHVVDFLRRCLELPTTPAPATPGRLAARAWCSMAADALVGAPPQSDLDALTAAAANDPLLELLPIVVADPSILAEVARRAALIATDDDPAAPSLAERLTTDPDDLLLEGIDDYARTAAPADLDPLVSVLGPEVVSRLEALFADWDWFHSLACDGLLEGIDPALSGWMGPDLFAVQSLDGLPPTCDTLATVDTLAPLAARYIVSLCASRGWSLDDPDGLGPEAAVDLTLSP